MHKLKAIIFDFDGVIAESVNIKTEAFAEMYKPFGKDVVCKVVEHHLVNGGMSRFEKFKYYHKEYLNQVIDEEKVQDLSNKFSKLVINKVVQAPFVKGACEFLKENFMKFDFFISSATPTNEIFEIIKRKKILPFFKDYYGSPTKKSEHVKNIMLKYKYNKNEVVFVGDALSDKEAAKINGIKFIGRFTTDKRMKKERNLIKDFFQLEKLLSTLKK